MKTVFLVGHPNSGKTTLFNQLTGSQAPVGNWAGVTVDSCRADLHLEAETVTLVDLPGIYSVFEAAVSEDEGVAQQALQTGSDAIAPPTVLQIINATQLERQLFLTSELLECGLPLVVVLTQVDAAVKAGIQIDQQALAVALGCVVVTPSEVKAALQEPSVPTGLVLDVDPTWLAARTARQAALMASGVSSLAAARMAMQGCQSITPDADLVWADARYRAVHEICQAVQSRQDIVSQQWTARIDRIVLNRWAGVPIFFGMMYLVFFVAMGLGGTLQSWMDAATQWLFVTQAQLGLQALHSPQWLEGLLVNGVGRGLNTTFTLLPVLGVMFFCLSMLEQSGYMARVAFVMDRFMRFLGLPGKAFVPLLIGFGCNVPAVLASRTLQHRRDRLLTALMAPYMSCSARLAIYTVFVSAFFHESAHNVVFSLYLLGMVVAILTGYLLRTVWGFGHLAPLILELPTYHPLRWRWLTKMTWFRLVAFFKRALWLIVPVCFLLSVGELLVWPGRAVSVLTTVGQWVSPLFAPMGIDAQNWPAVVGLLTGMLAKEVVLGTMNALYQPTGATFSALLQHHFHSLASVYAYLSFILLYLPCVSTMVALKQETSLKWMWGSVMWSLGLAYGIAVLLYQVLPWIGVN